MGYISHSAVIVTVDSWVTGFEEFKTRFEELRNYKTEPAFKGTAGRYMPEPVHGINGTWTFWVAPDGSKEGWTESDQMDWVREEVVKAASNLEYADVVTLRFGGDDYNRLDANLVQNKDSEDEE